MLAIEATGDEPGRRYRVVTDRGTWQARHVVVATGPHGTPYLPGAWRACDGVDVITVEPLPQPRPARPGRRARRRRLVVRACRSPTSSTGPGATSSSPSAGTPGCRAATAAWTSSGGWRAPAVWPGPSTRSPTPRPPAGRPSLQLVGRGDPDARHARTSTWPRCRPAASGWPDASRWSPAAGRGSGATWPPASPPPTRRCSACSTASTSSSTGSGWRARCWETRPAPTDRGPRRARAPRPARGGHRHRAGGRRLPPGAPLAAAADHHADGSLRQHRGVTAAAGFYVVGQRFQHRRDSELHRRRPARRPRRRHPPALGRPRRSAGSRRQESAA